MAKVGIVNGKRFGYAGYGKGSGYFKKSSASVMR